MQLKTIKLKTLLKKRKKKKQKKKNLGALCSTGGTFLLAARSQWETYFVVGASNLLVWYNVDVAIVVITCL